MGTKRGKDNNKNKHKADSRKKSDDETQVSDSDIEKREENPDDFEWGNQGEEEDE